MSRFAVGFCRFSALVVFTVSGHLGGMPALDAGDAMGGAHYQPGTPFTYLFDTGSSSPRPLSARVLAAKDGWTLVPEDNTEHTFRGDAVLLNDKLSVVLRVKGPGAEVYSQTPRGAKFRAVVMSAPRGAVAVTGMSSLRIVENNPGAVMVDAVFQTDRGGPCSATYRLTTGQAILEMTGGPSADRFFVWCKTRYVVVPDYFADDMVFSPAACDLSRFGLPTENWLLSLIEGGDAMAMCVWESATQDAYAVLTGEGPDRAIRGCEVQGGENEPLWVAFLEGPDIWRREVLALEDGWLGDWKPPFDATWRVDCLFDEPFTGSFNVSKAEIEAPLKIEEPIPSEPDRQGRVAGPQAKLIPRAAEHMPTPVIQVPAPAVVYPLDRNAATPLTTFCPVDVLRNTLGVGPCQYVLQTEGLASDTDPTPDHVMDWVEDQFKKNRELESADEIKNRLRAMADHVGRTQARIDEYAALAGELRTMCQAEQRDDHVGAAIPRFVRILDEMEQAIAAGWPDAVLPARAAELVDEIVSLIGKDNALAQCEGRATEVRQLGAVQDRMLSKCRMAVRWLNEQAKMSAVRDPAGAELAGKVRARCERFLQDQ